MFKLAIRAQQQGLSYLMLDKHYDYMLAIQDAMDEAKFHLVLTLFSKTAEDKIIQQKNDKNQTLFHILAHNCSSCSAVHLDRIYLTLKRRGVDMAAVDNYSRTALHYAVKSNSLQLVQKILNETDYKIDVN